MYVDSVHGEMIQIHQRLGYCPQFDALCNELTTEEHLTFYARLRGVPENDVETVLHLGGNVWVHALLCIMQIAIQ